MRVELDPSRSNADIAEKLAKEHNASLSIVALLDDRGLLHVQAWGRDAKLDGLAQTLGLAIAPGIDEVAKMHVYAPAEAGTLQRAPTGNDKAEEKER